MSPHRSGCEVKSKLARGDGNESQDQRPLEPRALTFTRRQHCAPFGQAICDPHPRPPLDKVEGESRQRRGQEHRVDVAPPTPAERKTGADGPAEEKKTSHAGCSNRKEQGRSLLVHVQRGLTAVAHWAVAIEKARRVPDCQERCGAIRARTRDLMPRGYALVRALQGFGRPLSRRDRSYLPHRSPSSPR